MLFKEKENQIQYLTYDKKDKVKQRHFTLNTDILENINEIIKVFNKKHENLHLNSDTLATIIFNSFFIEFETLTDQEKLEYIKKGLLEQIHNY